MGARLPIIYVRGFAGSGSAIDRAVDDPFYGFNTGATHIRIGREGLPRFHQFEGPLLRLLTEHGYQLKVHGDQGELLLQAEDDSISAQTIWVYRFYDQAASTFGRDAQPFTLEAAACGLAEFVDLVLAKTSEADQVNLVAHSMGGLICRSLIQRYLDKPAKRIAKVFTFGTPHGGIETEVGAWIARQVMEVFGPGGTDIFRPPRMYEYLTPSDPGKPLPPKPEDWDPRSLGEATFPADHFFCLVGTDANDYDAAAGLSALGVGAKSDGLVQIHNAYVKGASRAYVHRSHSGRYGMVNSEEGYQNLQRFLFGRLKVETGLRGISLDTSDERTWQAEVRLSIRGVPVLIHEQTAEHYCPILLSEEALRLGTRGSPLPLITTYLLAAPAGAQYARYALNLRVSKLQESHGILHLNDHLEQIAEWEDTLVVDVCVSDDNTTMDGWWDWNSLVPGEISKVTRMRNQLVHQQGTGSSEAPGWTAGIPVTDTGRAVLGPQAELSLAVLPWS